MNKVSLRSLRYFVVAAQERSITRAAERLHISPGSISTAVTELEAMLQVQLFVRQRARGTTLTPAGDELLAEARSLLDQADEFELRAGALGHAVKGELRVACFTNLAPVYFASLLAGFSALHPEVQVSVFIGNHEELVRGLRDGSFELALAFDLDLSDHFDWLRLATVPPRVVLPAGHKLGAQQAISLSAVVDEPLVLMDLPHTREYFMSLFYSLRLSPRIRYRSTSFEAVRTLVGNGLGYSILNLVPRGSGTYDGTLVRHLSIEEDLRPLEIGCLTLKRVGRRRVAAAFMAHAETFFSQPVLVLECRSSHNRTAV